MKISEASLRSGFYAGVVVAIGLGVYLAQLWQSDRQLELHSAHLLHAIEQKDWRTIGEFIDPVYHDQWQHDRAMLLARIRAVLQYTRDLHLQAREPLVVATAEGQEWRARIVVSGDDNDVTALIKARINPLAEPFRLRWRQQSWKPWDWKLVGASNDSLELPEIAGF
ncbi:MAG: hypothetical protein ABR526_02645 [Chthoniobacterales bacterium]